MQRILKILPALAALITYSTAHAYYNSAIVGYKDERDVIKEIHVFHIMLDDQKKAEKIARELLSLPNDKQLEEFKSFAKRFSSDAESAPRGGDLGTITQGTVGELFDDSVFSLPPRKVSGPIKSKYGWHVIFVASTLEHPISAICSETLSKSIASAKGTLKKTLEFSGRVVDRTTLHTKVQELIGGGWSSPLQDENKNLVFFRLNPQKSGGTQSVTIHTDYLFALHSPIYGRCKRSERKTFEIDCKDRTVVPTQYTEYEGRGASGRILGTAEVHPSLLPRQPATEGFYSQLYSYACQKR